LRALAAATPTVWPSGAAFASPSGSRMAM
jgi:hypothetical protein